MTLSTESEGGSIKYRLLLQRSVGLAGLVLILIGCFPTAEVKPSSGAAATSGLEATATPTSCAGWTCKLRGNVYVNAIRPGNELPGVTVRLSHVSYCSSTRGDHETITGRDGTFQFEVYLHDTDTFWFEVAEEGHEPVRQSMGGFDCLFCSCPAVEIVLKPY